jgi:hypothetical protein
METQGRFAVAHKKNFNFHIKPGRISEFQNVLLIRYVALIKLFFYHKFRTSQNFFKKLDQTKFALTGNKSKSHGCY